MKEVTIFDGATHFLAIRRRPALEHRQGLYRVCRLRFRIRYNLRALHVLSFATLLLNPKHMQFVLKTPILVENLLLMTL